LQDLSRLRLSLSSRRRATGQYVRRVTQNEPHKNNYSQYGQMTRGK
jgi:hypothetical protein